MCSSSKVRKPRYGRRRYAVLRIPDFVVERVHRRYSRTWVAVVKCSRIQRIYTDTPYGSRDPAPIWRGWLHLLPAPTITRRNAKCSRTPEAHFGSEETSVPMPPFG